MERIGGVMISGGSACTGSVSLPSHVLDTLDVPDAYIHGSLRISFGQRNTMQEVTGILIPTLRTVLANVG